MKKGDSFELSYAWWHSEGAKTLPKSGLGKALKAYEAADSKFGSLDSRDGVIYMQAYLDLKDAVEGVDKARLSAIGLCKEAIHKETKEALQKNTVITQREKQLLLDASKELMPYLEALEKTIGLIEKAAAAFNKALKDASQPKADGADKLQAKKICVDMYGNIGKRIQSLDDNLEHFPKGGAFKANFSTMGARLDSAQKFRRNIGLKGMFQEAKSVFGSDLPIKEIN